MTSINQSARLSENLNRCRRFPLLLIAITLLLTACSSLTADKGVEGSIQKQIVDNRTTDEIILAKDPASESRQLAAAGVNFLEDGETDSALSNFNKALKLDTTNSFLNFLAGLAYHLSASDGDTTKLELAEQGYRLAVKFDRTNWIARYHLGLLNLDRRRFAAAQNDFAGALLYKNDDPDLLYNMVVASYYARDAQTAGVVLNQLRRYEPKSSRVLRSGSVVYAALSDVERANKDYKLLAKSSENGILVSQLARRIEDWKQFHTSMQFSQSGFRTDRDRLKSVPVRSRKFIQLAQDSSNPLEDDDSNDPETSDDSSSDDSEKSEDDSDDEKSESDESEDDSNNSDTEGKMVIVDVVIMRTEENYSTSKGVNLLSGLQMRFGTSSSDAFGLTRSTTKSADSSTYINTRAITGIISVPAITYSMNIANANDQRNEILARPTLTAVNGKESEFFSGVQIKGAALPTSTGGTSEPSEIDELVGVKLSVTPEMLDDGRISLEVAAERTFLNSPNSNITGFSNRIETSKTTVSANVTMRYGETLILSGLSEREGQNNRDSVPGLGDVPMLQYLFSKQTTLDFKKSVLILVTPREPEFIYKTGDRKKDGSSSSTALDEFRGRYSDWFRPYPSWASVFHHMQSNSLYREFRTGDVAQEDWEEHVTRSSRFRNALNFLYY